MQTSLPVLLTLSILSGHCIAVDRAEHRSIKSPDKRFVVVFTGANVL